MTDLESRSPRRARREAERDHHRPSGYPSGPRDGGAARPLAGPRGQQQRDEHRGDPRRGSHATPLGQGFSWVVLWTIAGTVLPGSGLIAAGWRKLGGLVLGVVALCALALVALVFTGDPLKRIAGVAVDPTKLLVLVVLIALVGLLMALLVVLTNAELRRYATLSGAQRAFSTLVVVALICGIAAPTYKAASYALIARSTVSSVFGGPSKNTTSAKPKTNQADPWAGTPRVNVLLIGSDAGPDRTGVRPDSMILASINTVTGDTVLFSLPRNLERAPFPDGTPGHTAYPDGFWCAQDACLLNAVWTWAEGNRNLFPGDPNPGLTATEQAVQGVTGLKPDYYAMLNLSGFQGFVNAIGGITVNVTERIPIGGDSESGCGRGGYIQPGVQHLNGYKALWYARSRCASTDYDRMQRQRCVIGDIASQTNPVTMLQAFPALAQTAKNNISTDIPQQDLQAWVDLTLKIKKAQVRSLPFTNAVIRPADPDFDKIHALVQANLNPQPKTTAPTPSASASTGTGTGRKKTPTAGTTPTPDTTTAQDVTSVC